MKKIKYTLASLTIVGALLLSSCAKENNKYDKILTDGTWNVTSWEQKSETVQNKNYVNSGDIDKTHTEISTSSLSGSTLTEVDYSEDKDSPGLTTFNRNTNGSQYSLTFTFNEDGTFTYNNSKALRTASAEDETGSLGSANFSDPAEVTTYTGYWNWANTTDTKTQIQLTNLGTFDVTVEKGKVTFTKADNYVSTYLDNDIVGDYNYTETQTSNLTFSTSK